MKAQFYRRAMFRVFSPKMCATDSENYGNLILVLDTHYGLMSMLGVLLHSVQVPAHYGKFSKSPSERCSQRVTPDPLSLLSTPCWYN